VAKALGTSVSPHAPAAGARGPVAPSPPAMSRELVSLDAAMQRHIEAALAVTAGRIEGPAGAARLLEINPHTLRARMRKLGIDWKRFRPPEL
jgi:hydrogenase-4 transcriptional activator